MMLSLCFKPHHTRQQYSLTLRNILMSFVCVCMFVQMHVYMCVHTCGSQSLPSALFPSHSSPYFYFCASMHMCEESVPLYICVSMYGEHMYVDAHEGPKSQSLISDVL